MGASGDPWGALGATWELLAGPWDTLGVTLGALCWSLAAFGLHFGSIFRYLGLLAGSESAFFEISEVWFCAQESQNS